MGKHSFFRVNLGMCPLKSIHLRKTSTVMRVSTDICGICKEIDGKTFIFSSKPRHVTPQIDRLEKMSAVLRISTDIYGGL